MASYELPSEDKRKTKEFKSNLQKYCKWRARMYVTISRIVQTSHDTYIYTCDLPDSDLPLGLQTGQHIRVHAKVPTSTNSEGKSIKRSYTPTSPPDQLGSFDLPFKVYRKGTHPKFPKGGLMTQYLETLKVGDKIQISGPAVGLFYAGPGHLQVMSVAHIGVKHLGLICGGTGIAVMYPVVRAIVNNPKDKTTVNLLFANRREEDIIFREELESLTKDSRVKIYYILSDGSSEWEGLKGHVDKQVIQKTMPAPGKETFMWICGPPEMDRALARELVELEYPKDRTVVASKGSYRLRIMFKSLFCLN